MTESQPEFPGEPVAAPPAEPAEAVEPAAEAVEPAVEAEPAPAVEAEPAEPQTVADEPVVVDEPVAEEPAPEPVAPEPAAVAPAAAPALDGEPAFADLGIHPDVLRALTDARLVRRIHPPGSVARYESRVGDNHHHVVCRSCGAIADVACAVGDAPCLSPAEDHGYVIDEAEVIHWGLCPACSTQPVVNSTR